MKRSLAAVAALALGLGIAFIPVSASADVITDPDISHLDFPTPSDPRSLRVTVPSSVIAGASKNSNGIAGAAARLRKQKAAALLANSRVTNGAQLLNDKNGPKVRTWLPEVIGSKAAAAKAAVASKFTVPATVSKNLTKLGNGVGAASAVMVGAEGGFAVGKGIASFMGFDVEGGLCNPSFEDLGLIGAITGTDCDNYMALLADFVINQDAQLNKAFGNVCTQGYCFKILGQNDQGLTCFTATPLAPSGTFVRFYVKYGNNLSGRAGVRGAPFDSPVDNGGCFAAYNTRNTIELITRIPESTSSGLSVYAAATSVSVYMELPGATTTFPQSPYVNATEANPDPSRYLTCEIVGTDGITYRAQTSPFRESDGKLPTPECPSLPQGVDPASIKVNQSGPNGDREIWGENTTDEYKDWRRDFPECDSGMCILDLSRKNPKKPTEWITCFASPLDACADWFTAPNKATEYLCEYAGITVPQKECNVYANVFKPENFTIGAPWADPDDGTDLPPGGVKGKLFAKPKVGLPPQSFENCWPTGWAAFNPLQWIAQPIQCVIVWAFVPRPEALEIEVARAGPSWGGTPPGKLAEFIEETGEDLPEMDGCTGPHVKYEIDLRAVVPGWLLSVDDYPMNACEGQPLHTAALWINRIASAVIFFAAGVAVTRYVGSVVGAPQLGKS